jgi:proteasome assembly chaperone (PAC2) family protein
MISLIAEIPAYIQGHNPKCIDEVVKMLSVVLSLHIEHEDLRKAGEQFEKKVTEIVANHPELQSHIYKLEEDYDNEVFDTEMGDVKEWLQKQGIRVD